jgi:hypothetical protein
MLPAEYIGSPLTESSKEQVIDEVLNPGAPAELSPSLVSGIVG